MSRSNTAPLILLRVKAPMTHPVHAVPGERILVRMGHPEPVVVFRDAAPNYGALLGHLEDGVLEAVTDSIEARALLAATVTAVSPPRPPVAAVSGEPACRSSVLPKPRWLQLLCLAVIVVGLSA